MTTAVDELSINSGGDVNVNSTKSTTIDDVTGKDINMNVNGDVNAGKGNEKGANITGENLNLKAKGSVGPEKAVITDVSGKEDITSGTGVVNTAKPTPKPTPTPTPTPAPSPTPAPTPTVTGPYTTIQTDDTITYDTKNGTAQVIKIEGNSKSKAAKSVKISKLYDPVTKRMVPVIDILKNTFNSKKGRRVKTLTVAPPSGINIVIHTGAFNKSKVKKIKIKLGKKGKLTIKKKAWKKTKAKKVKITIWAKKAKQVVVKKKAFKYLSKKSVIKVKKMSKKQFKKLRKKLKKAGFKGKIKR